jgi:hypothetical protein
VTHGPEDDGRRAHRHFVESGFDLRRRENDEDFASADDVACFGVDETLGRRGFRARRMSEQGRREAEDEDVRDASGIHRESLAPGFDSWE